MVRCAECRCTPQDCLNVSPIGKCRACTKDVCCCLTIRQGKSAMMLAQDDCCTSGVCDEDKALAGPKFDFFHHAKRLYVAALGIEILCIAAAEIGENTGLYMFGFNSVGIP